MLIALDFDGVLNEYMGWQGEEHLADLRPGAREFIGELKSRGYQLCIHTCRDPGQVRIWLAKFNLAQHIDFVTNVKPAASVYIDDRALRFKGDYDAILIDIDRFEPYWLKEQPQLKIKGASNAR